MAIIKPFQAVRPSEDKAHLVASPPYDVVDTKQAKELAKGNSDSFLHVVRPEIDLPEGTSLYSEEAYNKAAENLKKLMKQGSLVKEDKPCLYAYSQRMGGHLQTGIVACCSVDDYDNDVIRKHEKTRQNKEEDRTKLILRTEAQTGPVFLLYRDIEKIDVSMKRGCPSTPLYSFTASDEVVHTVYKISDEECIRDIVEQFSKIRYLYVADGHHRSAAASRARAEKKKNNHDHTGEEEYNFFLAVLFPASSLDILPYNRVVKDVAGLSKEELFQKIRKHFRISETEDFVPRMKGSFGMYYQGKWYHLVDKPWEHRTDDPVKKLDASLLQNHLLGPILNIEDPRTDDRIDFVGGIHGHTELKRRVDDGEAEIAFLMYPVTVENLIEVSDAGKTMPPKSTWFEPKLRSGLFTHLI